MKKFLRRCMLVLIAVVGTFAFAGCLDEDEGGNGGGGDNSGTQTHQHEWVRSSWESNSAQHWHKCTGCDEKTDASSHSCTNDTCTVCGFSRAHTHVWGTDYLKDENHHWQKCTGCSETTSKVSHTYSGNTCTKCGHTKETSNIDVISSARDLEVITMATDAGGVATLVKLPDGKNMLIGAGSDDLYSEMKIDEVLLANEVSVIDYFVLTNTAEARVGGADYIFDYYEVKNFYNPTVGSGITPSTSYTTALQKAASEAGCTVKTIAESSCDISYTFKDSKNGYHTYEIDFMLPVDFATAANDNDASVVVAIKYKNKTILLAGEATVANIDGYCTKYGTSKNVDVLVTNYLMGDNKDAIRNSFVRGSDYLNKISLTDGDYMVMVTNSGTTGAGDLNTAVSNLGVNVTAIRSNATTTSTAKISTSGVVSVTAE